MNFFSRSCLAAILLVCFNGVLMAEGFATDSRARPNIVLIVADDVGYSDLGCYGGEIDTPNLDQLAMKGVRFSEFHVNPMCVVTRTSLMSGTLIHSPIVIDIPYRLRS